MRIKLTRDKIIRARTAIRKSLVGERVLLRPLSRDDLPYIQEWSRDAELRRLTGEVASMSRTGVQKWYKELLADKDRAWYAIVLRKSGRVIGEAGLLRIFLPWRNTDMSIVIEEKDEQGKGYGTEVGYLLLRYAFRQLGLHRISIGVAALNERGLKFWESLGFKKEGVHREEYYCDNRYSDFVMLSILENEFTEKDEASR